MLDAFHPGGDGLLDGSRGVGVHRDVGAPVFGRFHRGTKFRFGEGGDIQRAVGRGDAAAGGELDLRGALHQLFTDADTHFIGRVGDGDVAGLLQVRGGTADGAGQVDRLAKIAVAAGDGNHRARWKDAWAGHHVLIDGPLEGEHRATHVAHGGETAHQGVVSLGGGQDVEESHVGVLDSCKVRAHEHRVPVRVDQARHQRSTATVDDPRARRRLDVAGGDAFDQVAANQHVVAGGGTAVLTIEDPHVAKQRRRRLWLGGASGIGLREGSGRDCAHGQENPDSEGSMPFHHNSNPWD
ncbi:hypothetical protein FQZ97_897270 [compost metagenome]